VQAQAWHSSSALDGACRLFATFIGEEEQPHEDSRLDSEMSDSRKYAIGHQKENGSQSHKEVRPRAEN
jgi:hypothetical protein